MWNINKTIMILSLVFVTVCLCASVWMSYVLRFVCDDSRISCGLRMACILSDKHEKSERRQSLRIEVVERIRGAVNMSR